MNLIWLIFAHYIGDIALQSEWQANTKGKYWYIMLCHCMIWSAIICVALQYMGMMSLWKVPFLILGHWVIDIQKCREYEKSKKWSLIYPDQILHFAQILVVYFIL